MSDLTLYLCGEIRQIKGNQTGRLGYSVYHLLSHSVISMLVSKQTSCSWNKIHEDTMSVKAIGWDLNSLAESIIWQHFFSLVVYALQFLTLWKKQRFCHGSSAILLEDFSPWLFGITSPWMTSTSSSFAFERHLLLTCSLITNGWANLTGEAGWNMGMEIDVNPAAWVPHLPTDFIVRTLMVRCQIYELFCSINAHISI